MIISTGIDVVEVHRIEEAITRTPRFAERVFTPAEREYCISKGKAKFQSFAARFAAKEAFLKAIKTGWRGKISWHDIEVVLDENGAPSFLLRDEAAVILRRSGAASVHLSISHTNNIAIASVILE